ncbi:MAG: tetratricopeptide repeat protein, partial [Polyangiaceae bacterium]
MYDQVRKLEALISRSHPMIRVRFHPMFRVTSAPASRPPFAVRAAFAVAIAVSMAFLSPAARAQSALGSRSARSLRWDDAKAYIDQHDLPRAIDACRKLGRLPGAEADGHACLAQAYLIWQRATEALAETALALAKDPRCYEAKMAEGRAYELSLEPAQAETAFRDAVALAPDTEPSKGAAARAGLGRVLLGRGKKDDGLTQLRDAVKLDPDGADALFELGKALAPSPESV